MVDLALKNAHEMLKRIMDEVDTNGDGKIQYEGMPVSLGDEAVRPYCLPGCWHFMRIHPNQRHHAP